MESSSTIPTTARVSQRAPQSCTICAQKKMRCSKTVPCETCLHQGIAHLCRREQVVITKDLRITKQHEPEQTRAKRKATSTGQHPKRKRNRTSAHFTSQSDGLNPLLPTPRSNADSTELSPAPHEPAGRSNPTFGDSLPSYVGEDQFAYGQHLSHNFEARSSDPELSNQSDRVDRRHGDRSSQSPSSTEDNEFSPFEGPVSSLEFLVWGRQRDKNLASSPSPIRVQPPGLDADSIVSPQEARVILEYYQNWLTWTHNFIHWPHMLEECRVYWTDGMVKERAWVALYYALLCVGVHHMSTTTRLELGIDASPELPERLYRKCLAILRDADYTSVHSIRSVQTICLLVLCAHDFDGSNAFPVLLSSAIRIAQTLKMHRLGPDPVEGLSPEKALEREIQKTVWMFLTTQDWLLIPFSNAYTISPRHYTTPLPSNCNSIAGLSGKIEPFNSLPSNEPTHASHALAVFKLSQVYREFFDAASTLSTAQGKESAMRALYDEVLKADSKLKAITRATSKDLQDINNESNDSSVHPRWVKRQRYHFAISVAHKTLTIHHPFFLKSLVDHWYTYTRVTCIKCARTILTQLKSISSIDDGHSTNLWTIVAHAISASIILLLAMIFSEDDESSDDTVATNRQLICDCLDILRRSSKASSMTTRGIDLIELLLTYVSSPGEGTMSLKGKGGLDVKQIAAYLAKDKPLSFPAEISEPLLQFDPSDLEEWMNSMGLSFDATYVWT